MSEKYIDPQESVKMIPRKNAYLSALKNWSDRLESAQRQFMDPDTRWRYKLKKYEEHMKKKEASGGL